MIVRAYARVQPQGSPLADFPLQLSHLGQAARESVASIGGEQGPPS
jgi:hypothetical protein